MKKTSIALAALIIVISAFFAACGGADDGKVSDSSSRVDITTTENISNTTQGLTDLLTSASDFLAPGTSSSASTDAATR